MVYFYSLGRRLVFYLCVIVTVLGRTLTMISSNHYVLFSISAVVDSLGAISIIQGPLIIAMEISNPYVYNQKKHAECPFYFFASVCLTLAPWLNAFQAATR